MINFTAIANGINLFNLVHYMVVNLENKFRAPGLGPTKLDMVLNTVGSALTTVGETAQTVAAVQQMATSQVATIVAMYKNPASGGFPDVSTLPPLEGFTAAVAPKKSSLDAIMEG